MLETLCQEGIVRAGQLDIAPVHAHLETCLVWNAHVKVYATALPKPLLEAPWPAFCHDMEDVVCAPGLLEAALEFYALARDYFDGEPPLLYSLNAFWTQPASGRYEMTHSWHRDTDDRRQLVMFVYGCDVNSAADGAHLYQRGTHRLSDQALGRPSTEPPASEVETILGAAGTVFLVDTTGLHMGLRPQNSRRLLLWARWGVSDPPESYKWDKLSPTPKERLGSRYPSDLELQRAIRLVVC